MYVMNDDIVRRDLWNDLIDKIDGCLDRWIVCGDFNVVLNTDERLSKFGFNFREIDGFDDCIDNARFVNL